MHHVQTLHRTAEDGVFAIEPGVFSVVIKNCEPFLQCFIVLAWGYDF